MELSRRITLADLVGGPPDADPMHRLSRRLLAGASVTNTLQAWCEEHGIAAGPVWADRRHGIASPMPDQAVLRALRPTQGESLRSRVVILRRDDLALSEAHTWYVPERLHPWMRHILASTLASFTVVVEAMRPNRRTTRVIDALNRLEHHTLVAACSGQPIALVQARYHASLAVAWPDLE